MHCKQYGPYQDIEQLKEGLNRKISQNNLGIRNNGQHLTTTPRNSQVN